MTSSNIIDPHDCTDLLSQLNDNQRAAVEYIDGPELVIAGAGSGKTRVLTYKIAYLLRHGMAPWRIMALTFTNKAAREMKERIASLIDHDTASRLWMGTFHSIFLKLLRRHTELLGYPKDFTIYDSSDSRSLIKMICKELDLNDQQYKPATIASIISNAKNALISARQYAMDADYTRSDKAANREMMPHIYSLYEKRCRAAGAMDFDDILMNMNVLLRDHPKVAQQYSELFEYILVDEYQDTNFAQSLALRNLARDKKRICVVGDDAQSIYAFRGANIGNILSMNSRYDNLKTYKLEQNYRSTQNIVNLANSLIKKNHNQLPKDVYSRNAVGAKIEVTEAHSDYEEAAYVASDISRASRRRGNEYSDFAVLYRTNAQSRPLEEALRRLAIPYRIYGGLTFYQRKEVKDALAYFRLIVNNDDDEALRRIINFPARGIGATTLAKVQKCAIEHDASMWQIISHPQKYNLPVNKGTERKLSDFADMICEIRDDETARDNAYELGQLVYRHTGLLNLYAHSRTPEDVSKYENLYELLNGLKEFVEIKQAQGQDQNMSMATFLSEVMLLTDQDVPDNDDSPKVTLMTIHAAKGLEFKHVMITGLEDELFPSTHAIDSLSEMEEERRLLYVAITRAMETVQLYYSLTRFRNGETKSQVPSRFFYDLDPQYLSGTAKILTMLRGKNATQRHTPIRPQRVIIHSSSSAPALCTANANDRLHPVTVNTSNPSATTPKTTSILLPTQLTPGVKVYHDKFGEGIVHEISNPGPDSRVIVNFSEYGLKTLMVRFAKLHSI